MEIISIQNQKGGVGKTTTTVNLAAGLSKKGKKVLLIDFDPQGNSTSYLGINKQEVAYNIYDLLKKEAGIEQKKIDLNDTVIKIEDNLDILSSNIKMAKADLIFGGVFGRELLLSKLIKKEINSKKYDYLLIDCPPALGLLTINALAISDKVIIPVQTEMSSIEGLADLLDTIEMTKENFNPNLKIEGILMTMVDLRLNAVEEMKEYLNSKFPNKVFNSFIRRNSKISESWGEGNIFKYDQKSNGAKDYNKFVAEFLEREKQSNN